MDAEKTVPTLMSILIVILVVSAIAYFLSATYNQIVTANAVQEALENGLARVHLRG